MNARPHTVCAAFIFVSALSCAAQEIPQQVQNPLTQPLPAGQSSETYCQSLLPPSPMSNALKNACMFSLSAIKVMPDFTCEMDVEKYEDVTNNYRSTQPMQKIRAHARYVNGIDYYDNLQINGRPSNNGALIEGTWSFGEFGAKLLAAFNPKNHPVFKYTGKGKVNGIEAYEYEFHVQHENNKFWRWKWGKKSTLPGYDGHLWVARRDGAILRLRLGSAGGVPEDFPIQTVESVTDYTFVDFKDRSGFILPSKSQIQTRMLDHRFYRTRINFEHCQRFRVDSRIVADAPPQP
jgi:hypothetical protein